MPENIRRSALAWIPDQVMCAVDKGVLFTDFFVRSFQMGDPYNIAALKGIFYLIHYHNL